MLVTVSLSPTRPFLPTEAVPTRWSPVEEGCVEWGRCDAAETEAAPDMRFLAKMRGWGRGAAPMVQS